jgi:hypothetical protein
MAPFVLGRHGEIAIIYFSYSHLIPCKGRQYHKKYARADSHPQQFSLLGRLKNGKDTISSLAFQHKLILVN